jgi:hypothetical protein
MYLGDFNAGDIIDFKFCTVGTTGAPTTLAATPALSAYKSNGTTETTTGITLTTDFDTRVGLHHVRIDTSADATFYANGNDFQMIITSGTVGGVSVVGYVIAHFSLRNRGVTLRSITHTGATVPTVSTLTGHTPQTGDTFARLGAPTGASIAADIATIDDFIDTEIGAIKAITDALPLKRNTAYNNFHFMMFDSTTGAGKTGISDASFTKKIVIDNGSQASISGTITEVDATNFPGLYRVSLTSGEMNGTNITLRFAASGAKEGEFTLITSP